MINLNLLFLNSHSAIIKDNVTINDKMKNLIHMLLSSKDFPSKDIEVYKTG